MSTRTFRIAAPGAVVVVLATTMLMSAWAQHHDPFAGSNCTCETFCNYECAINATQPANLTLYRMTPKGVLGMDNKNTGDAHGDTSFVLSHRLTAYECREDPNSFFCSNLAQFEGDDKNSTDLIESLTIEVDGQWGPYLYCNPDNISDPLGSWSCKVDITPGGNAGPPPPQCKAANVTVYSDLCWNGFNPKVVPADSLGDCCAIASKEGKTKFQFDTVKKNCELYTFAFNVKSCKGYDLAFHEQGPETPPCNCSRVHQSAGRENLLNNNYGNQYIAGGEWYSHPLGGMCEEGQPLGFKNCTWRVVKVNKVIHAPCMYQHLDDNVVQNDPDCFSRCTKPYNVTSECYLECYTASTKTMSKDALTQPWSTAFSSDTVGDGGCPPATTA
eukprot:m.38482 g.38482  ORF g.38482 m.38482 type:complete len:386 (-) comp14630_c0_seq1:217-1374(-)